MANAFIRELQRQHPKFFKAIAADIRFALASRSEPLASNSKLHIALQGLRLCWTSDAFFGQTCYRAKARLQRFRIPVIPTVLHRLAMLHSQICIGTPVVIEPGIYLAHGQVVIDGFTKIGSYTTVFPWVTIGLTKANFQGPIIESNVTIGTGAKIIGPVTIGEGSSVGANAVVVDDVAPFATVVGIPAKPITQSQ